MALTEKRVARAKDPGRYGDGHGLYLQINANGAKSWLFRYTYGKPPQERWMGLGPLHVFDLKEAREKAKEARQQLAQGIDPLVARNAAKAAQLSAAAKEPMTFEKCADEFIKANRAGWKNIKHSQQWTATLATYVYPTIGKLDVADVDTELVLKCIQPIWATKTETASRVRGRIESILDWATALKKRHGDNPARWDGNLEFLLPARSKVNKSKSHPALPHAQIPEFMAELRQREGVAARALEFTILCASRTNEVIGAPWSEFDLDKAEWTIPGPRMKAEKDHTVTLSARAVELLRNAYREDNNPFVFIGAERGEGLSNMSMTSVIKRMNHDRAKRGMPKWVDPKQGDREVTTHGFRSSFRDWAAEKTSVQEIVVEKALAHTIPSKVEKAYRRGDLIEKRRILMEAWATYCSSPVAAEGTVVVPFPAGARS